MGMRSKAGAAVFVAMIAACSSFGGSDNTQSDTPDASTSAETGPVTGTAIDDAFTIAAPTDTVTLQTDKPATVHLNLTFGADVTEAQVKISVTGPKGITAAPLVIDGTEGDLVLTASTEATQGQVDVEIEGLSATHAGVPVTAKAKISAFVRGAPGTVDTTWAAGGTLSSVFGTLWDGGDIIEMLLAPDDSVYAVSTCTDSGQSHTCIAHVKADGTLDSSYGSAGVGVHHVGKPSAMTLLAGGSVVVACGTEGSTRLIRFNSVGSPDAAFGTGVDGPGTEAVGAAGLSGSNQGAYAIRTRPDGNLLLLFQNQSSSGVRYAASMLLQPNGTLITSYGTANGATTHGVDTFEIAAVNVKSDNSFVLTRVTLVDYLQQLYSMNYHSLSPMGAETNTYKSYSLPAFLDATNVGSLLRLDGTIVVPFSAGMQNAKKLWIRAFSADGTAFADSLPVDLVENDVKGIAAQADGKILVTTGGGGIYGGGAGLDLLRFGSDLLLDTAFGTAGHTTTSKSTLSQSGKVVVQKSGRILVADHRVLPTNSAAVTAIWP